MWSKGILLICVAFFLSNSLAANKCWYSKCISFNKTFCENEEIVCTENVAKASIAFLKDQYDYNIQTDKYSTKYECFEHQTVDWRKFSDGRLLEKYLIHRSCIPQNVKVCDLKRRSKRDLTIVDGGTKYGCFQCGTDLCDSSASLIGSWKVISGIILILIFKQFLYKC